MGSAERLWGNPRFFDVAKLIVMRAGQVIGILKRPAGVLKPVLSTGIKAGAKAGEAQHDPMPVQARLRLRLVE